MNSASYERLVSKLANRMTNHPDLVHLGKVNYGQRNKWRGSSGFRHQIDVSLEDDRHVLLVECKRWKYRVKAESFLVLWARVMDISHGPDSRGREVRGALVTSRDFQSGVAKLADHYKHEISTFLVSKDGEFEIRSHTHFIGPSSIQSGEQVGIPTVIQSAPKRGSSPPT